MVNDTRQMSGSNAFVQAHGGVAFLLEYGMICG